MTVALSFEHVTKHYRRAAATRQSSLRQLLSFGRARGKGPNSASQPRPAALDDVSFQVDEGTAFGLIGPNGSGKSTALKLACRISSPTGGRVRVAGKVGALLEVGSGVHPELTGRENIWLYGSILGLSRRQLAARFADIIDFAGLVHVLDQQVKYYSTGMQLRLGFSIASHLDPDIFIVDEALAVGDAAFQARCVERMSQIVREGRTLVFVSHAVSTVLALCGQAGLLHNGRLVAFGPTSPVIDQYTHLLSSLRIDSGTDVISVISTSVDSLSPCRSGLSTDDAVIVTIELSAATDLMEVMVNLAVLSPNGGSLMTFSSLSAARPLTLAKGSSRLTVYIPSLPLLPGTYELVFSATCAVTASYYTDPRVVTTFFVSSGPSERQGDLWFASTPSYGPIHVPFQIRLEPSRAVRNTSPDP